MLPVLNDTAGLGSFFWLLGYLAGIVLFFKPFADTMGWIILGIFTPVTIWITWWWFRPRERLSLQ